jgi:hypothetical protein
VPRWHAHGGARGQARGEHRYRVTGPARSLLRHGLRKVQVMAVRGGGGGPAPLLRHGSEVFHGHVALIPVAGYQGDEPVRQG